MQHEEQGCVGTDRKRGGLEAEKNPGVSEETPGFGFAEFAEGCLRQMATIRIRLVEFPNARRHPPLAVPLPQR